MTISSPATLAQPQASDFDPAEPWRAFDRIYCISLANRPDRYAAARAQFQRVGLAKLIEFVIVEKHPTDSEQGIFESHIACLRAGLAAGAEKIAVFEDDILFSRFSPQRLNRAVQFMESQDNWDLFFFGCFVNSSQTTPYHSVIKVNYRCAAHGYVVSRNFARKIVEMPWTKIPYDDLLRSASADGVYALYPAFAFQSDSATDNDNLRGVDRARRIFGGMRRLQRWNEFSSRRRIPLIIGHVVVALALTTILLLHHPAHAR